MTPRYRPFALGIALSLAALVAACGGGGDDDDTSRPGNLTDPRDVPTATHRTAAKQPLGCPANAAKRTPSSPATRPPASPRSAVSPPTNSSTPTPASIPPLCTSATSGTSRGG